MAQSHQNPSLERLKPDMDRKTINPTIGQVHHRNLPEKTSNHASIVIVINILWMGAGT